MSFMTKGLRSIPVITLLLAALEMTLVNSWAATLQTYEWLAIALLNVMMILFLTQWLEAEKEIANAKALRLE